VFNKRNHFRRLFSFFFFSFFLVLSSLKTEQNKTSSNHPSLKDKNVMLLKEVGEASDISGLLRPTARPDPDKNKSRLQSGRVCQLAFVHGFTNVVAQACGNAAFQHPIRRSHFVELGVFSNSRYLEQMPPVFVGVQAASRAVVVFACRSRSRMGERA
jgi:hypothetical protein